MYWVQLNSNRKQDRVIDNLLNYNLKNICNYKLLYKCIIFVKIYTNKNLFINKFKNNKRSMYVSKVVYNIIS